MRSVRVQIESLKSKNRKGHEKSCKDKLVFQDKKEVPLAVFDLEIRFFIYPPYPLSEMKAPFSLVSFQKT